MSTKAIREALSLARARNGFGDTEEEMLADKAAMEAIEAIERAAKWLSECSIEYIEPVTDAQANAAHDLMASIAKDAP